MPDDAPDRFAGTWLQQAARTSGDHLLASDPALLSPVGRDLRDMVLAEREAERLAAGVPESGAVILPLRPSLRSRPHAPSATGDAGNRARRPAP